MKEQGDQTSVFLDTTCKPPDRSTSAPPVLALNSDSLFAFRAAEHLHLFSDIRCEENYYEFYKKYQEQGKPLPAPLESQPFLVDRSFFSAEDEQIHRMLEQRISVSCEARNMPPARSSSNPQHIRAALERYDSSQLDEFANSPTNESIWTPLPRKMANLVLEDFSLDERQEERHMHQSQPQAPRPYYPDNFDVAYSTANQLLQEDNIQSLWNDRGVERPINFRPASNPTITAPTPTVPTQPSILSLLNGNGKLNNVDSSFGYYPDPTSPRGADGMSKTSPRRRASSGGPARIISPPISTTSPPPVTLMPGVGGQQSLPICRYFAQGYCSRGERCNFLHELDSSQFPPVTPMQDKNDLASKGKVKKSAASPPLASSVDLKKMPRRVSLNGMAEVPFTNGNTSPTKPEIISQRQYSTIEQVIGHIYSLCKDQHGCRFLQKKLEERDARVVELIFNEVYEHMVELMIDPFGNYLCQKLLEHCTEHQRTVIIEKVSNDLVKISKNMHGTRAVQKMIEYLTSPEQVALIRQALKNHVVTLIQDLNGNHVIQRCLNKLSPEDNQFIYDSVSQTNSCVEVATHRHGCCVLQRCIDHASDTQKLQLINEIIANALVLVQDPYGNYVVQYVLDLPFPGLASELARRFIGHIPILSTQKFSSNVVEKCLGVADPHTRALIIQEVIEYDNLLYLLQDPYANYVIQTSLNVSEPMQHARLVEAIRPHLPALRNTPYGKRIQNKILKESSRDYYA
jgi:hypothetical protein